MDAAPLSAIAGLPAVQLPVRCATMRRSCSLRQSGSTQMYYQSSLETPLWLLRLFSAERYRGSRLQFGVLGPHLLPTLLPLPVQITHVVSSL